MYKILENNEKAFYKRYGISLLSKWKQLSDEIQRNSLHMAEQFNKTHLWDHPDFCKDEILRIVLGFTGKINLENTLEDALPVLKLVLWEPDEALFEAYCSITDISNIISDKRLTIVLGSDLAVLKSALAANIYDYNIYHCKILSVGNYTSQTNPRVLELTNIITELSRDVVMDPNARKCFGKLPCENLLYSIRYLGNNYIINQLFDSIPIRDIPVIIVSAGPSLMKNYKDLRKAKGKAIIVAVSHALKTLNNGKIIPDLVAVTDPLQTEFINYTDNKDITLMSAAYADRKCGIMYSGRVVYYGFNLFSDLFLIERTSNELLAEIDTGSVSTDMLSIFIAAGFSRFILVGQDLAYGEDGYTHTGNEYDNSDNEEDEYSFEVIGINGEMVKTRGDWDRFRRYIEKRITENKNIHIIDATEGGAYINGSDIMTLEKAIEKYCCKEYSVSEWIQNLNKKDGGDEEERNSIEQWFNKALLDTEIMERNLNEIIKLNELIRTLWKDTSKWDNEFSAKCKKYDVLYNVILNGSTGLLLCNYCMDVIQKYLECALVLEGDENIEPRMKLEHELFEYMKDKSKNLCEYLQSLIKEKM